jgi:hypothetical protein
VGIVEDTAHALLTVLVFSIASRFRLQTVRNRIEDNLHAISQVPLQGVHFVTFHVL